MRISRDAAVVLATGGEFDASIFYRFFKKGAGFPVAGINRVAVAAIAGITCDTVIAAALTGSDRHRVETTVLQIL